MAQTKEKGPRNTDVWLIMVIILLVLSLGGGLYLTGQSLLARLEVMSAQTRGQISRLEVEVFEMRKQLQTVEFNQRQMMKGRTTASMPTQ